MRSAVLIAGVVAVGLSPLAAKLPRTADECKQHVSQEADTPQGAIHVWFEAVYLMLSDDPDLSALGPELMDQICADANWSRNQLFAAQMKKKPYIFRSYCDGTSPDNGYQMDPDDFTLMLGRLVPADDGQSCQLELRSSGAGQPRPAKLVRQDGQWWVAQFGNLYAGVKPPRP